MIYFLETNKTIKNDDDHYKINVSKVKKNTFFSGTK